jgi:integrase
VTLPEWRSHAVAPMRGRAARAATLLLGRSVNPKIVSEMLGHASIGITLDTYSHVLPTMQQSSAAEMDAALTSV